MGTRAVMGFRKNNVDKYQYVHYNGYPEGLGRELVYALKDTTIEQLNTIYDNIQMVSGKEPPTIEQKKACFKYANINVSNQSLDDWYCLLRNAQGNLHAYKEGLVYMLDSGDFIKNSLFCEYAYIINLDTNELEFWTGFQKKPDSSNRYGVEPSHIIEEDEKYYPCKLQKTFPLGDIPADVVKQMLGAVSE